MSYKKTVIIIHNIIYNTSKLKVIVICDPCGFLFTFLFTYKIIFFVEKMSWRFPTQAMVMQCVN